ncbi:unnamed protein product [Macrosiphum euphorbiae]|uniref:DDE Tnp4 domain-containing protein n=1 Tax=Macrosiphum euphorbiae TaxID=13131 RepID=A0AAV0Y0X7_9HEMI|nr:unnamed protein product [Macrosiphum euphorbiae]
MADELEILYNYQNIVNDLDINIFNEDRRFMAQEDPFTILSDRKFLGTYRLSKSLVKEICQTLSPHMMAPKTNAGLSIDRKLSIALRFFASGSYQQDIGEHRGSALSQASVSRCITEVANALNLPQIMNQYIRFPSTINELNSIRLGFYEKYGVPGVVGVLDCTHIAIVPPKQHDIIYPEHIYVNRKGYHSINTQLICDCDLKILNVCAKFPGSAHDSHIWRVSPVLDVLKYIHSIRQTSNFLLGDSGYGLRPWLLTPIHEPEVGGP